MKSGSETNKHAFSFNINSVFINGNIVKLLKNINSFGPNSNHIEINDFNIKEFIGTPAIWYKYVDNKVIDFMVTSDIHREYNSIKNSLKYPKNIKYSKIKEKYGENIKFYIIQDIKLKGNNKIKWNEALLIEILLAIKTGANKEFWGPAPGFQIKNYIKIINNI